VIGSDFEKHLISQTPLGRFGQPEDIAPVAVFLSSEESYWITGEISSLQAACARNSKSLPHRSYLALFDAGLAPEQTENSFLRTGGWSWR
jgi:hypothetical protein